MKVLGIVSESRYGNGDGSFLVELTRDEMAKLAGWPYYDDRAKTIIVGSEVDVGEMYSHLRKIASAPNELKKAKDTIEAVASLLQLPGVIADAADAAKGCK